MKILQILQDDYLPTVCGNARVVETFHKMISANGWNDDAVIVWNKERPEYQEIDNVPVYNINGSRSDRRDIARTIMEIATERKVDLIICHAYDDAVYDALNEMNWRNTKRVLVQHYWDHRLNKVANRYNGIIAFQYPQLWRYVNKQGISFRRMLLCPPGLDFDNEYTEPLPVKERKPRSIIYGGRLNDYKGVHQLIPWVQYMDVTYTVVGPQTDVEYIKRLKNMAEHYGVENRVIIRDTMTPLELAKEFQQHQFFVLPSRSDCFSLVLREAMASGCSCVMLRSSDAFEWAGQHAYHAPSYEWMARYIRRCLADGTINSEYEYAKSLFDIKQLSIDFGKFLEDI